jgi:two-component system chemotaxis response regulator CheY
MSHFKGGSSMAKRIMLALEAPFMTMVLATILMDLGYEVIAKVNTGLNAIETYKQLKPDLVFMDLILPDMDSADAIQAITDVDAAAMIIVCTSLGKQKEILDALKCGAKDFVLKPYTPSSIKEVMDKSFALR